jgi:hypothetical protein
MAGPTLQDLIERDARTWQLTGADRRQLTLNGLADAYGNHVPVARYADRLGRVQVYLVGFEKNTVGRLVGLVDLGNGQPEIGPIDVKAFWALEGEDPTYKLERDWDFDPKGKGVHEILAELRSARN